MLASITPLGERGRRSRWGVTVTAFAARCDRRGGRRRGRPRAARRASPGWTARARGRGWRSWPELWRWPSRSTRAARRVPGPRRQVDERWLDRYRGWVYGLGYGSQLGLAVTTVVSSAATYVALLAALLRGERGGRGDHPRLLRRGPRPHPAGRGARTQPAPAAGAPPRAGAVARSGAVGAVGAQVAIAGRRGGSGGHCDACWGRTDSGRAAGRLERPGVPAPGRRRHAARRRLPAAARRRRVRRPRARELMPAGVDLPGPHRVPPGRWPRARSGPVRLPPHPAGARSHRVQLQGAGPPAPGQAGAQHFFTAAGRPFCLYVVVSGPRSERRRQLAALNHVLRSLKVQPAASVPV